MMRISCVSPPTFRGVLLHPYVIFGKATGHPRRSSTKSARAIDLHDAQAHLLQLVVQAKHGHEVILTERGEPVAKIVPISAPAKRQFGSAIGLITMSEDFDEPLEDFRGYASMSTKLGRA